MRSIEEMREYLATEIARGMRKRRYRNRDVWHGMARMIAYAAGTNHLDEYDDAFQAARIALSDWRAEQAAQRLSVKAN